MKATELHLPGLEMAASLLLENPSSGAFTQKLDEALGQARAAAERASRQDAPPDYALPAEDHPAIDRHAPLLKNPSNLLNSVFRSTPERALGSDG